MQNVDMFRNKHLMFAPIVALDYKGGDHRVQCIAITAEVHANPDSAHDPATQMREQPIAFLEKRKKTINPGRRRHPVLILILIFAQLVGIDSTATKKVHGVIFFHVHTTLMNWGVTGVPALLGGGNGSQGVGGAIEGEEAVRRLH